jgi:hypothetical protein
MSIVYCHTCGTQRDTDFDVDCPCGEVENPIAALAYQLADADWLAEGTRYQKLNEARRINALSDNFAYTNGSDEAYRRSIAASRKRLDGLFQAMLRFC